MLSARAELDDDVPVQGRRLGGVRQGLHQEHSREGALRRPQRHARSRMRRHHRAHSGTARLRRLYAVDHPQVQKALRLHPRRSRRTDGSWYGRWGVNYIYGTWQVLRGLRALKINMNQPWLLKARALARKRAAPRTAAGANAATPTTIRFSKARVPAPPRRPPGRSWACAPLTIPHRPSLQRGIEYLIRTQNPDGSWTRRRNHRHRFSEGLLPQVRHVSQRLAVAGAGDLPEAPAKTRCKARRTGERPVAPFAENARQSEPVASRPPRVTIPFDGAQLQPSINVLPASCRQSERKKTLRIAKQPRAHQALRAPATVRTFLACSFLPAGRRQHVASACCRHLAGRANGRRRCELPSSLERTRHFGRGPRFKRFWRVRFCRRDADSTLRQRAAGILPAERTEEDASNHQAASSAPGTSGVGQGTNVSGAVVSAGGTPAAR